MMYPSINFLNEMNSFGTGKGWSMSRWGCFLVNSCCSLWGGECSSHCTLFFFLESDHFCGFVYEGIYNLIVWDAGPSRLQRSWSIGIGPQVCLSYTGLNQRENALFYEQNLYLPLIDVCSMLSDCWFHCTLYLSPKKAAWLWYPSPLKLPKLLISSSNSIGWCYSVAPKIFRCTLQIPILPPFRKHHIYGSGEFSIRIFSGSCL